MTYVRTNWVNDQTPLNADNMNNIEAGIEQALAQGGAVVITSGGSITEKTFTIPTLTNKQVVDAHNALASGKPCIVDSQDGTEHYIVDNANGSTIAINIVYSNKLIVTYTENSGAEDANATISSVELGGGGSKLYQHFISLKYASIVNIVLHPITSNSSIPFTSTSLQSYLSSNNLGGVGASGIMQSSVSDDDYIRNVYRFNQSGKLSELKATIDFVNSKIVWDSTAIWDSRIVFTDTVVEL